MRIRLYFGTLDINFTPTKGVPWTVEREVKKILFPNGKLNTGMRIQAIKKFRNLTGGTLKEGIAYTNKFFPSESRIGIFDND